jgi:hypothetical protein
LPSVWHNTTVNSQLLALAATDRSLDGLHSRHGRDSGQKIPALPGVQQITFIMHTAKCAVSINGHMGVFVDHDITTTRKGLS